MDQQGLSVELAVGILKANRFSQRCSSWFVLARGFVCFGERWFGDAVDYDLLARLVVVADVTEIKVRRSLVRARSDRHVFPIARLGALDAKNAARITGCVERVNEWSIPGIVVRPVDVWICS